MLLSQHEIILPFRNLWRLMIMGMILSKTLLISIAATTLMLGTTAIAQQPGGGMGAPGMGGAGMAAPGMAAPGTGGQLTSSGAGAGGLSLIEPFQVSDGGNGGLSSCFPNCGDEIASNGGGNSLDDPLNKNDAWAIPELNTIGMPVALALLAGIGAVALERRYRKLHK